MQYIVRKAEIRDLKGLCLIRNNQGLFASYLMKQKNKEAVLCVAESADQVILGFDLLRLIGQWIPKLSDLYVKESIANDTMQKYIIG